MLFRRCVLAAGIFAAAGVLLCNFSYALAQEEAQPIKISSNSGHVTRSIVLWLGKAAIVELPVEAKDVLVANPEIVDAVVRTPTRTYLLGQKVGTTNAFFFDASGKQILNVEIRVERDVSAIEGALKRYLPKSRIKIESLNDSIVLTGTVASAADADKARSIAVRFLGDEKRVFSMITIAAGEQVLLRVRVAEMQRSIAKQLGINMDSLFDIGEVALDLSTANPFGLAGRALSDTIWSSSLGKAEESRTNPPGCNGCTGNFSNVGSGLNQKNFNARSTIQALERHGLLRTLAEPNLTAISGENAKFLAGGEFPVPKSRDRDGNVTIEYKPFGVGLAFTPVVLSEGRISLRISTEVSELQQQGSFVAPSSFITDPSTDKLVEVKGLTIPALRVRRAETTVELPSGGSLVMAGLLQQSSKQEIDALPGLKELPVLGALFQSRDFQNDETELVVMVTPYLVGPVKDKDIRLPTDGFAPATDFETIFLGRLNAVYGKSKEAPTARRLEGPIGFILE
jgi:pilus assembly protein CpaC